ILYPLANVAFTDDPTALLRGLTEETRMILFVATIIIQWFIFTFILGASYTENTGLAGLGFRRLRLLDFFWAAAFFGVAALILSGLAKVLELAGMPMLGEIKFLIPQDSTGRIVWVALSLTAGICEETAFRGYLMTRLRLVGGFQSWLIPTIVSALVFGACHAYQGLPGFIVISVYGALFSLLFIYTRSIWPAIIAHFFQDFIALFIPQ
ncbi:MAG: CPBP family intramembrane glutamic endopeptidase, partial [Candidatus Zixiibacteriota bacterium]